MPTKYRVGKRLDPLPDSYGERSRYDWINIRKDYIEGALDEDGTVIWPSVSALAIKYDINGQQISNRANKERWSDHRDAHQRQIAVARQKAAAVDLAKKAVKFDEQAAEMAVTAQTAIQNRLIQIMQIQEVDKDRIDTLLEEIATTHEVPEALRKELRPLVSAAEFESLMKALALANEVGRKALGIKDDEPAIRQQVNIETTISNNVTQQLRQSNEERNQALLNFFNNKNIRIPGVTSGTQLELEPGLVEDEEGEIVEAEYAE